jgi:hypothetical protein
MGLKRLTGGFWNILRVSGNKGQRDEQVKGLMVALQ